MASRLNLQTFLEKILESRNVYFQPPESVKMKYPAIVYALDDIENVHADNGVYSSHRHYSVTIIDSDPDSELVGKVVSIPTCRFERYYASENVRCMTLTQNVDPEVYTRLSAENYAAINAYIEAPMTATCLIEEKQTRGNKETVTSELIYYWMISYNIPVEFQKWHLNRLLTLIRVCNVKNSPPKRRSKREMWNRNAAINAANRKRFGSKG